MTAFQDKRQAPTARELQQRAAAVLARLLSAELPPVLWWTVSTGGLPGYGTKPFHTKPMTFPLLAGQADAHSTVRAWAAHLGTDVHLDYGTTPSTGAVIDGIGVRIWCAPRYRDDIAPGQNHVGPGGEDR